MGVPGLWDILKEAGHSRALTNLTVVDGFEGNPSGRRASRLGIDASLWYFHAENSTDAGSNPELRLLFFRLCTLRRSPVIPLFVFDGRMRPRVKRGKKTGKSGSHWLTNDFKEMLECFGMEWRMAQGEAEAELAYLNRIGVIDAVVTDDADAFLFGAKTVIRNMSLNLTGNKNNPAQNLEGNNSSYHVRVFEADAIESHRNIQLKRGGLILFAMISGGDYDNGSGVRNFGPNVAHGLARCGFGDRLLAAYHNTPAHFRDFLPHWRAEVSQEIRTNSMGFLPGRRDVSLPAAFPDIDIFESYANPICSGRNTQHSGLALRDRGNMNLARIAAFCEQKFDEWGHKSAILKRFSNVLWDGAVMHVLRRAALEADEKERSKRLLQRADTLTIAGPLRPTVAEAVGTPASLVKRYLDSPAENHVASAFVNRAAPAATFPMDVADTDPLIVKITQTRTSVNTDNLPEFRVVVNPTQLVRLATAGIKGKHPEPSSQEAPQGTPGSQTAKKKRAAEPKQEVRMWIPVSIMRQVHPKLVETFEAGKAKTPRTNKGKKRARPDEGDTEEDEDGDEDGPPEPRSSQARPPAVPAPSQPRPAPRPVAAAPAAPALPAAPIAGPSKLRRASAEPKSTAPRPTQPQRSSHPPPTAARAPLLDVKPPISHMNPVFPRVFFNVGLIETEEPLAANAFVFTFTDPDDPDYLFADEDEPMDDQPEELEPPVEIPQAHHPHMSASQPQPQHHNSARPPSPARVSMTQPAAPAARPPTVPQPHPPATQRPRQAAPERVDHAAGQRSPAGDSSGQSAFHRFDDMFDQILGIAPGAVGRKAKKTTRARALGLQLADEPARSQQPKRRKTATAASTAVPSSSQPATTNIPSFSQRAAAFPNRPPLVGPPRATGSQPRPQSHLQRDPDVIILDSDEEGSSFTRPAKPMPPPRPLRWPGSQDTASSQESRMDADGFFSGVDYYARLS